MWKKKKQKKKKTETRSNLHRTNKPQAETQYDYDNLKQLLTRKNKIKKKKI